MVLNGLKSTNTANIVTASDEDESTVVELADALDFIVVKLELDGVVQADVWVWVADGAAVMGHDVWDLVLANHLAGNFAQLVVGLLLVDTVRHEAALNIVQNTELLASLFNSHNVLESEREFMVAADLVVNLDVTFTALDNLEDFLSVECILQSLAEKDREWDALTELVRASGWTC